MKLIKSRIAAILFLAMGVQGHAQYGHVDHWETALYAWENWRYHVGTTPPDSNWNGRLFNDSHWARGKGGFGYGDGDDSTVVPQTTSIYIRKTFTIKDRSKLVSAILQGDYDDAFVAYLNGLEIYREGIGKPWKEPLHTDTADYPREAKLYKNEGFEDFVIHPNSVRNFLVDGDNVLAIQIHNFNKVDDDMSAWFNLHFGIKDSSSQFAPAPTWFERPPLHESVSSLPIVYLEYDTTINSETKVPGRIRVLYNGKNKPHFFGDINYQFDGKIAIKHRGNSTLQFPKKSFRFETQTSLGENLDVSLLGLPKENDWVLYAPYIDKSLLRNQLAYKVAYKTDAYGVLTQPCEVFANGYYIGVYYLMEKIKRDDHRVDIKKVSKKDTTGIELTGGYILKRDWLDTAHVKGDYWFHIPHDDQYQNFEFNAFQYYDPDPDSIQPQQKAYIQGFMRKMENVLLSEGFKDPDTGYNRYIDISSFADYLISREFGKEIDSYKYSVYMYKKNDENGGLLHMGPSWDFNIGFGNVDFSTTGAEQPKGWLYTEGGAKLFWFERLMEDPKFANILNCRYAYHRANVMSRENINKILDETIAELGEAAYRNHYMWKTIGRYVWPNYFVGESYQEEVDYLKEWVDKRLDWMDINMPGDCAIHMGELEIASESDIFSFVVFPNPSRGLINIETDVTIASTEVRDLTGRLVYDDDQLFDQRISIDLSHVSPGLYLLNATSSTGKVISRRIVLE